MRAVVDTNVIAYFVELAERLELPLLTYDRAIIRAFPETARTPSHVR